MNKKNFDNLQFEIEKKEEKKKKRKKPKMKVSGSSVKKLQKIITSQPGKKK